MHRIAVQTIQRAYVSIDVQTPTRAYESITVHILTRTHESMTIQTLTRAYESHHCPNTNASIWVTSLSKQYHEHIIQLLSKRSHHRHIAVPTRTRAQHLPCLKRAATTCPKRARRVLHEINLTNIDNTGRYINCEDGLSIPFWVSHCLGYSVDDTVWT